MSTRLTFLLRNYLFWITFCLIFRLIFLGYHFQAFSQIPCSLIPGIFIHGFHMDLSMASYLSCIPLLLIVLSNYLPERLMNAGLFFHSLLFVIALSLISTSDLEIFHIWGCHVDATALRYLASPREAFASSYSSPLLLLAGFFFTISTLFTIIYVRHIQSLIRSISSIGFWNYPFAIVAFTLIAVTARGGFQQIPLNDSFACFSNNDFANQVAINTHWNFFSSLLKKSYITKNPYKYLPLSEAKGIATKDFSQDKTCQLPEILKTKTPNIILIIWESLTSQAVEAMGGVAGVTPGFNRLTREGLLFSHIYSTGDRTSKGLTGILSGYPAQPKSPIITFTEKTSQLPSIGASLKKCGYSTSFYYGGETEFDNMKTYLNFGKFDRIVGRESFTRELSKSKWGAHDHTVFERAFADLKKETLPFFSVILTLSSHEPFEVPMKTIIPGVDIPSKFKNSLFYSDQVVEAFAQKLKMEPWYDDTLIIVIADHGTPILGDTPRFSPEKYHIPLLFFGGALIPRGSIISRIGSQQDLSRTLLEQLDINADDFNFSRNLLSEPSEHFAEFFYNDGFTLVNERGHVAFDNSSQRFLARSPLITDEDVLLGKAIMQTTYQDYLNKGNRSLEKKDP